MQGNENQAVQIITGDAPLTRKQETAVLALLTSPTLKEAAAAVNVSEVTLWRWTQAEAFQKAFLAARRDVVKHSIAQLQQASGEAVSTLCEVMRDPATPAAARVSAAKTLLSFSLKAVEVEDLEQRVRELERLLEPGDE